MVVGVGEGARAAYVGAKIAGHVAVDVAEHVGEDELAHVGEDALEHAGEDALERACPLSFAASTLVATPGGEHAIASLNVGDSVQAYDPTTGQPSTQTVEATHINHDTDLLDVTLRENVQAAPVATSSATSRASDVGATISAHSVARKAPASVKNAKATRAAIPATSGTTTSYDETIHTTASHPWLTADHGWLPAGFLRIGEAVRQIDGSTATVVTIHIVPGAASMWDLTVSQVHDFAVGNGRFVVHNCGASGGANDTVGNPDNYIGDYGGTHLYTGQAVDAKFTDPVSDSGWAQIQFDPEAHTNHSTNFSRYIGQKYPGESAYDWNYAIETWLNPDTKMPVTNHYWYNPKHLNEFYHHHMS
ncbi:MAG TPA: hypothetical protein VGP82_03180 [Ktedonobacterales bacterium]|nr:hypothetical protein [Ktedonobacterales bacterium]